MEKLIGKVRAAVEKYRMIEAGDKIAVGVSGGKDSLFLLCALAALSRYYPKPFSLIALTADPCFGGREMDLAPVSQLCESLGVPYIIEKTNLGRVIFEDRKEPNPCSLCARKSCTTFACGKGRASWPWGTIRMTRCKLC